MKKDALHSFRLTDEENERFWFIMDKAKARNPYASKTDVFRELLGLNSPTALTQKEIDYFRQNTETTAENGRVTDDKVEFIADAVIPPLMDARNLPKKPIINPRIPENFVHSPNNKTAVLERRRAAEPPKQSKKKRTGT